MVTQGKEFNTGLTFSRKKSLKRPSLVHPSLLEVPDLTFKAGNVTEIHLPSSRQVFCPPKLHYYSINLPNARNQRHGKMP